MLWTLENTLCTLLINASIEVMSQYQRGDYWQQLRSTFLQLTYPRPGSIMLAAAFSTAQGGKPAIISGRLTNREVQASGTFLGDTKTKLKGYDVGI